MTKFVASLDTTNNLEKVYINDGIKERCLMPSVDMNKCDVLQRKIAELNRKLEKQDTALDQANFLVTENTNLVKNLQQRVNILELRKMPMFETQMQQTHRVLKELYQNVSKLLIDPGGLPTKPHASPGHKDDNQSNALLYRYKLKSGFKSLAFLLIVEAGWKMQKRSVRSMGKTWQTRNSSVNTANGDDKSNAVHTYHNQGQLCFNSNFSYQSSCSVPVAACHNGKRVKNIFDTPPPSPR